MRKLIFACLIGLSLSHSPAYACSEKLLGSEAGMTKMWELLRGKFIKASDKYAKAFPKRKTSLLRGTEYKYLKPETLTNSHAFYLASGGDLYRLLVDFPAVDHYHLLDTWMGWGRSPEHVLATLKHRLDQFAENVVVEQAGFIESLAAFPTLDLNQAGAYLDALHGAEAAYRTDTRPIVISFDVKIPNTHFRARKRIWMHRFDFSKQADYDALLGSIPVSEPIVGVLLAGLTGNPHSPNLNQLLDRMHPGSPYIKEFAAFEFSPFMNDPEIAKSTLLKDFQEYLGTDQIEIEMTPVREEENHFGAEPKATEMLLRKKSKP